MDPSQAQELYNFTDLTPEAQRLLYLRGLGFEEAARRLAEICDTDIVAMRHDLIQSASQRCEKVGDRDISFYWLMMKLTLTKSEESIA